MATSIAIAMMAAQLNSREERLLKALVDNRDRYTVDKDGFISLKLDHPDVLKEIARHVKNLSKIKVVS